MLGSEKEDNMATTVSGAEWNGFYSDPLFWGSNAWHEDETIYVDGVKTEEYDEVPITSKVKVVGGVILGLPNMEDGASLESSLRAWIKRQNTAIVVVEIDKTKKDALVSAIVSVGGRIR